MGITANEAKIKEDQYYKLSQIQKDDIATWNAAIEAAADKADKAGYETIAEVIRDLKK